MARQITEEDIAFAKKYAEKNGLSISGCKFRISNSGNIICQNPLATKEDFLVIPKKELLKEQKNRRKEEQKKREEERRQQKKDTLKRQAEIKKRLNDMSASAADEINTKKEAKKYKIFLGNVTVEADVSTTIDYTSISACIFVTLDICFKKNYIGHLTPAKRSVSLKENSSELTKEDLKKKILNVVKTPPQDVILSEEGGERIFHAMCKCLKSDKRLKLDENTWQVLNGNEHDLFALIFKMHSRKYENPQYKIGSFRNVKLNEKNMCFTYKSFNFTYDIVLDKVELNEQQRLKLYDLADKVNAQKKGIKACQKAITAIKQEYAGRNENINLKVKLSEDSLVVKSSKCMSPLEIRPGNNVTATDIKRWFKTEKTRKEKEEKRLQEEKIERVRLFSSYGNLAATAALKLIIKNEKYITENAVVKNLRGMRKTLQAPILDIPESGTFSLLTEDDVKDAIRTLKEDGLISRKEIEGTYGWFDILKPGPLAKDLCSAAYKEEKKPFSEYSDMDWINYIEKINAAGREPRLTNTQKQEQMMLLEHKAVVVLYPELVKEFLKIKPKEWNEYIETMYSMASGVERKYWKFVREIAGRRNRCK